MAKQKTFLVQIAVPNFFEVKVSATSKDAAQKKALGLPAGEWTNYHTPAPFEGGMVPEVVNIEEDEPRPWEAIH